MIPLKDQEIIRQKFAHQLVGPVKIDLFTEREMGLFIPGHRPCATCKPTREMLQELSSLSDLISLRVHIWNEADEERERFGIERIPATILRGPFDSAQGRRDRAVLKFYGLPSGNEFPGFIETIADVSRGEVHLSPESMKAIRKLKEDVTIRVFVTPTCPYCPQMARIACWVALANPKMHPEVIEVNEFPELAQRYGVRAVPFTVIADRVTIPGAVQERVLMEQLLKAIQSPISEPSTAAGPASPMPSGQEAPKRGQQRDSGLLIP